MKWVKRFVIWLGCLLFKHDYETYEYRRGRRLVRCCRCDKRWAMSDEHRAFLRYDNDEPFKADLKRMYPELKNLDI